MAKAVFVIVIYAGTSSNEIILKYTKLFAWEDKARQTILLRSLTILVLNKINLKTTIEKFMEYHIHGENLS